jgi:hypothetical protein
MTKPRVRLFHFFHSWSKWEVQAEGKYINEGGKIIGAYVKQRRQCVVCDLLEFKQKEFL